MAPDKASLDQEISAIETLLRDYETRSRSTSKKLMTLAILNRKSRSELSAAQSINQFNGSYTGTAISILNNLPYYLINRFAIAIPEYRVRDKNALLDHFESWQPLVPEDPAILDAFEVDVEYLKESPECNTLIDVNNSFRSLKC